MNHAMLFFTVSTNNFSYAVFSMLLKIELSYFMKKLLLQKI